MPTPIADTILTNARVRTMEADNPHATAVAIKDKRILHVGSDDDVAALKGPDTKTIDAGGRLVMPGFQDTHIHLQDTGTSLAYNADLEEAQTPADLQNMLRAEAANRPDQEWVKGVRWDVDRFSAANLDRHVLDAAVPDRPVYIFANDGHNAVVNSKACEVLGLDRNTPDPANGSFVRENGMPTGMLYEEAIYWALKQMPQTTLEHRQHGIKHGAAHANQHGITGVLDALVTETHMQAYGAVEEAGELTVRVKATAKVVDEESVADAVDRLKDLRDRYHSDLVHMHSAKFFLDGVFENGTAALLEDLSDGRNAPIMFDNDHLVELFAAFDAEKFQIHSHTIGDKAARSALDALQTARDRNGAWHSLHQLAHLQLVNRDDIPRFAQLGAVANVQPLWAVPEVNGLTPTNELLGPEREQWIYPIGAMIEAGAPYALSSDWGVTTLNPFQIIQIALTRQYPGSGPDDPCLLPQHRIDIETAVRGYTIHAAECAWRDDVSGTLCAGKYADLIITDRDIFNVPANDLWDTSVCLTMHDGREVYRASGFDT